MISSLTREGSCSSARTDVMVPWRGIHGGASYHYMLINANSRFFCHSFVLLVEPRFYTLSALVLPLRRWEETEANRKESISTSTPRGTMPRRLPSLNSIVASVLHLPRRQHTRHLNNFFAGMSEPLFTVTTVLRQGLPSLEAAAMDDTTATVGVARSLSVPIDTLEAYGRTTPPNSCMVSGGSWFTPQATALS